MAGDINRVTLVGRLTRDPELRHLPSGSPVLQMGLAVNGRQKDEGGNWIDKPNFFDIKVFGNQAEMLAQHLSKGRRVGIDGRLDWSSWEAQDGSKRSRSRSSRSRCSSSTAAAKAAESASTFRGRHRSRSLRLRPVERRRRHPLLEPTKESQDRWHEQTKGRRRPPGGGPPTRRKSCYFCKDKVDQVDYKNTNQLRRYISEKGKIRSRRITGACRRHQEQVAVAVKRAREMALLPYVESR